MGAVDPASDRTLAYGELHAVDEVLADMDQLALAATTAGSFGKKVPRQATSIVLVGTQPFNLTLNEANPPTVATAGVALIPSGVSLRIGLEMDHDTLIGIANTSAAAGNFTMLIFRRRRRQPRLYGQV